MVNMTPEWQKTMVDAYFFIAKNGRRLSARKVIKMTRLAGCKFRDSAALVFYASIKDALNIRTHYITGNA
jgi:hypothetical protein